MENTAKDMLIELGISNSDSIVPYYPQVRDRNDVAVLKCTKSGVLLLSRTDHMDISHYEEKSDFNYWGGGMDRNSAIRNTFEDTERRCEQFKNLILNKKWIDVGTGAGGILDALSTYALEVHAVEPQSEAGKILTELGYNMYRSIEDAPHDYFQVVTLFHVFEHFTDPLDTLLIIKEKMTKDAKIVIEIPHAKDFLISFLNNEPFKAFTFWSEHLILHTRESITTILNEAGFKNIVIEGFQRYPLANHIHWMVKGKPGGHLLWRELRSKNLDEEYQNMLAKIDKTDTLIITAQK